MLSRSGHFPMLDEPERFLDVLLDFMAETAPATAAVAAAAAS